MSAHQAGVTTMVERAGLGDYELPATIDGSRGDLAEEFLAQPLGRHRTELQLLLGRMRSDLRLPRLLLQRRDDGQYVVLAAPFRRGEQPTPLATVATREDAERFAFRHRWELATGTPAPGTDPPHHPVPAPPIADRILAYTSAMAVRPGERIDLHVSAPGPVDVSVVRLRSRRPSDAVPVEDVPPATHPAEERTLVPGSHGRVHLGHPAGTASATLQVNLCPVGTEPRRQVLVAWGDPWTAEGLAIHIDRDGVLRATVRAAAVSATVEVPKLRLEPWAWLTAAASLHDGILSLRVLDQGERVASATTEFEPVLDEAPGELVIGAVGPGGPRDARDHFDGRLEQVALATGRLSTEQVHLLSQPGGPELPPALGAQVIGWWDFSIDIPGWSITDRGPHEQHGAWHNLPRRGVCGSRWDGVTDDWRQAPEQYAAVHLLADALEDAGWPVTCSLTVPAVRSGVHAFRVRHADEEIDVPFVVLPRADEDVPVLLLLPTATYTAYANSRFWWEDPIQEAVSDRLVEIGPGDITLMARSEVGLSHYDQHADGTDVCHVSDRRPNAFLRAGNVHDEGYCSDLDLIEWLEGGDLPWAVTTDRALDEDPTVLDRCRVLLTGTHPEYVSGTEFDALERWVRRGGRMLYLGGNGFQTRVSFDRGRPWITENRRIEHWGGHWPTMDAERRLAADGELGGYVTQTGRSMMGLLGVQSVTMGFDESLPFQRTAHDPRTEWVFAGVPGDTIGDHGRIGGAVVGQEWDNAVGAPLPPDHHVLARTHDHSIVPSLFGAARAPYHCDMTIRFDPSGGAVFSVGTMAWCAALNDDERDVTTITRNVVDRFLDPQGWDTPG